MKPKDYYNNLLSEMGNGKIRKNKHLKFFSNSVGNGLICSAPLHRKHAYSNMNNF